MEKIIEKNEDDSFKLELINNNVLSNFISELQNETKRVNLLKLLSLPNTISTHKVEIINNQHMIRDGLIIFSSLVIYKNKSAWINDVKLTLEKNGIDNYETFYLIINNKEKIHSHTRSDKSEQIELYFSVDKIVDEIELITSNEVSLCSLGVHGTILTEFVRVSEIITNINNNIIDSSGYVLNKYENLINDKEIALSKINDSITENNIKLSSEKKLFVNLKEEIVETQGHYNQLNEILTNTKEINRELVKQHFELNKDIEQQTETISKIKNDLKKEEENLNKSLSDHETIRTQLEITKEDLYKYQKEASKYSTELKDFKDEIIKQNRTYLMLLLTFISTISFISYGIYTSSMQYIAIFSSPEKVDLIQLLLSRSPLILLNIGLITLYTKLLMILIPNVIDNNKQLSKIRQIEFLVKESVESLDLTTEDTIRYKLEYKMQIIKEALYLTRDNTSKSEKEDTKTDKLDAKFILNSLKEILDKK